MQIKINTDNKVIELTGTVSIRELLNTLKVLNIDKEEWSINAETKTVYTYIPAAKPLDWVQPYRPYTAKPWYGDIMCSNQMHAQQTGYNTTGSTFTQTP